MMLFFSSDNVVFVGLIVTPCRQQYQQVLKMQVINRLFPSESHKLKTTNIVAEFNYSIYPILVYYTANLIGYPFF